MKSATILGCGIVDEVGIDGTRGITATWSDLDMVAPGTAKTMRTVFDKEDATFRRIDLLARALVLACEAADLENVLTAEQRQDTAICVETDLGALATDVSFASSLGDECVHAGIFPYSLTSTSLGEMALRYKLRGPTISMSVRDDATGNERDPALAGEAVREALRMLACGDAQHVVVGVVDTMLVAAAGRPAILRAVVAVIAAPEHGSGIGTLEWPDGEVDPFAQFVSMCR
ncbi:MAG: 3-oxoacyl-(acyl-carrier-protein) synthase [Planctomycetota bacterium]|jgi:3-oxoacyl-(acyl-carrier-protein) synthase